MTSVARRGLLRILGASAAAIPMAPAALQAALTKHSGALAAATALMPSPGVAPSHVCDTHPLGKAVWLQVNKLRDVLEFERYDDGSVRVDGLDPDLACLRSTSHAWRARKQLQRNRDKHALAQAANQFLWPQS